MTFDSKPDKSPAAVSPDDARSQSPMTAGSSEKNTVELGKQPHTAHANEPMFVELDAAPEPETSVVASVDAPSQTNNPTPSSRRKVSSPVSPMRVSEQPAEDLDWRERMRRWLGGPTAMGYGASLLMHLILLILASIVIVRGMKGDDAFNTLLSNSADEDFEFAGPVDTDLVPEEEQPLVPPELKVITPLETTVLEKIASPADLAALDGSQGESAGSGFKFTMPEAGKTVTQGSFTAWTVPEDPKPGEDYLIVIQIQLPEQVKKYPSKDLSGRVVGTDGYRQSIPGRAPRYLPLKDHQTQLSITVPGADRLVKDRIVIESRRLEERQTLEIVF